MTVLILSGSQGAGKSSLCEKIAAAIPTEVVSADHYFTSEDGEYKFDFRKLGAAHADCMHRFVRAVQPIYDYPTVYPNDCLVIVDNTNTTVVEIAPYYLVGRAFDHRVIHLTIRAEPGAAQARNLHGVPIAGVTATAARVGELSLPPFWEVEKHDLQSDEVWGMSATEIVSLMSLDK